MASIKLRGDTSGEVTIQAPAVAGTTTLNLPATSSTLATQNALGVRNLIINGDMRIAQRGTSATGITSSGYYTIDRYKTDMNVAGTWTQTQSTDVPTGQGFANSLKMQCTTANASLASSAYLRLAQTFEGQMLQHLKKGTSSAESLTLSFWVKSNKTGTYIAELRDNDNTRDISKSYTIDTADTWEKKTITFAGDTTGSFDNDNNGSLVLEMWLASGSDRSSGTLQTSWGAIVNANRAAGQVNLADSTSNYINITGVQLEVGDTATPFEHRPYDMELARCQRYYEKSFPIETAPYYSFIDNPFSAGLDGVIAFNGTNIRGNYHWFKVTKRATPTIVAYNPANSSITGAWSGYSAGSWTSITSQGFYINPNAFGLYGTLSGATGGNPYLVAGGWTANAEL